MGVVEMGKLLISVGGAALLLAVAGCNSRNQPEATATTGVDTTAGMGLPTEAVPDGTATDMAPMPPEMPPETGSATMQGPGTGAPSPTPSPAQ